MTGLSALELSMMGTAQAGYLPSTCTILRGTATVNGLGEAITAWGTVAGTAACRLRPSGLTPAVAEVGEQAQTDAQWVLTLAQGADLQAGDRVVSGGDTYEVVQSWSGESWPTAVRGNLRRIA